MGSQNTLINSQRFETIYGPKFISLHNADISNLKVEVDILLVSAYKGGYETHVPETVFNALLKNLNINMKSVLKNCEYDFRKQLSGWVSREQENQNFKRIACIEIVNTYGKQKSYPTLINNLFSMLVLIESLNIKVESIALPLIGTGTQGIELEIMIPILIKNIEKIFLKLPSLKYIYIVQRGEEKCAIVSNELNLYFKRTSLDTYKIKISNEQFHNHLHTLLEKLYYIKNMGFIHEKNDTFLALINKFEEDGLEIFLFGSLIRRVLEIVVMDILGVDQLRDVTIPGTTKSIKDLNSGIQHIASKDFRVDENKIIPPWIIGYFQYCRLFGNEYTHEKDPNKTAIQYFPSDITDITIINSINILIGLIDFWIKYRNLKNEN